MTPTDLDLLRLARHSVTAPAGCGKTHLIAESLTRHSGPKPVLVLTHTNAGVAALRGRLDREGVPRNGYHLATIDGWAMRLIATFPARSAHDPAILELRSAATDYPNIRTSAANLMASGHVADVLAATYAGLIVDEYQDCSMQQHELISRTSEILPTCVLGDPMQAIFGFGGDPLARWDEDVCTQFPIAGELDTPWRWNNVNEHEFGEWLLDVRRRLKCGDVIDLHASPDAVKWIELDGTHNDHHARRRAAMVRPPNSDDRVLIIGDSVNRKSRSQFASQTPGAVTVETVDLEDMIEFARSFDLSKSDALDQLLQFASRTMTNVGRPELLRRIESIRRGTAKKVPSDVEQAAIEFSGTPTHQAARKVLVALNGQPGTRTYRPTILHSCIRALELCVDDGGLPLEEAAIRIREQHRFVGRALPRRSVGSTLLLKGLEAEMAVVLNATELKARNLYVAMTRASTRLVVCSQAPILSSKQEGEGSA